MEDEARKQLLQPLESWLAEEIQRCGVDEYRARVRLIVELVGKRERMRSAERTRLADLFIGWWLAEPIADRLQADLAGEPAAS